MPEFVIIVREHRFFGFLLSACLIKKENNREFFTISEYVNLQTKFEQTDNQKQIIKAIEDYSDKNITKLFSKKKNEKEFFESINDDMISKQIRPYIEKRIAKIINLLIDSKIRIFHKADKTNHVYAEDSITIFPSGAETVFNFIKTENETKYFLTIRHKNKDMKLTHTSAIILSNEPCMITLGNALYIFNDIDGKKLTPFFKKEFIIIPQSAEKKYFDTFISNIIEKYKVNAVGFDIFEIQPSKKMVLTIQADFVNEYAFIPEFHYDKYIFLPNNPNHIIVTFETKNHRYIFNKLYRNNEWEKQALDFLTHLGLKQTNDNTFKIPQKILVPEVQQLETINWLNKYKPEIENFGFEINQNIYNKKFFTQRVLLNFDIKNKIDWFEVEATVKFGEYEIPFVKLRHHILHRIREFILPNGEIAIIPEEWFAEYENIFLIAKEKNGKLTLHKQHFSILCTNKSNESINELNRLFSNISQQNLPVPENINATLRNYQFEGFLWLNALQINKFGGCLADDMGLGKTLQTLSFLVKLINEKKNIIEQSEPKTNEKQQLTLFDISEPETKITKKTTLSNLIVMPTSLIHNWENEIRKFAPHLKLLKYVNSDRHKYIQFFENYDIILTSYGIIRNDIDLLNKSHFFYVILDESQYIKNPDSKIYSAVSDLNTIHKLVLTGTPIENSLTDLWSQMNFINNGILGNLDYFKEQFVFPIEKSGDEKRQKQLQNLIKPFILRRTKEEVAKDLPPLTEQTIYCDFSETQRQIYEIEKAKIRNFLVECIENKQIEKSTILVLQSLLRLRQIANHPQMIDSNYLGDSGKFNEVLDYIKSLIAEKHKILVFSSFVKHLTLFANYFNNNNIKYSILTGNTKDRKQAIDHFQNDSENYVFLISIKAGGTGLNLTSADYVLLLDPWWNPAVELQAISRAHRIGQEKKVIVYRFISSDSIEEKIQQLQERKSELADMFIKTNNPLKALAGNDILDLVV